MQRPNPHVKANFAMLFDWENGEWQNIFNLNPQLCTIATNCSDAFGHWLLDKLSPCEIFVAHLDLIKRDEDLSAPICCPNRKSGSEKCLKLTFVASYFFSKWWGEKWAGHTLIYIFKWLFEFSRQIPLTLYSGLAYRDSLKNNDKEFRDQKFESNQSNRFKNETTMHKN